MKQELINKVLEQIVRDIESGDLTAIEELIADVPSDKATHYLPEELWDAADLTYQQEGASAYNRE